MPGTLAVMARFQGRITGEILGKCHSFSGETRSSWNSNLAEGVVVMVERNMFFHHERWKLDVKVGLLKLDPVISSQSYILCFQFESPVMLPICIAKKRPVSNSLKAADTAKVLFECAQNKEQLGIPGTVEETWEKSFSSWHMWSIGDKSRPHFRFQASIRYFYLIDKSFLKDMSWCLAIIDQTLLCWISFLVFKGCCFMLDLDQLHEPPIFKPSTPSMREQASKLAKIFCLGLPGAKGLGSIFGWSHWGLGCSKTWLLFERLTMTWLSWFRWQPKIIVTQCH